MPSPTTAVNTKRTTSSNNDRPPLSHRRAEEEELRPYVITGDLGKGSFATVYRGYHEETHKAVAIKTVNRHGLSHKLLDNLQGEITILKALAHRHITRLLDLVHGERNIYLIIEFCAGGDLSNYIKKRGRVEGLEYIPSPGAAPTYYLHPKTGGLDVTVVRSFLRQLARALKFLRRKNLIHRDIKPQNLLLNPASEQDIANGHPLGVPILKIADFGFARSLGPAMMAETLCGSPLYMAPEILRYEKYDEKADLWSVGAVLYEMSTARPPFRAANHVELIRKIEASRGIKFPDEDPTTVARRRENGESIAPVPADIKALIRALLKPLPAERIAFDQFFKHPAMENSRFPKPTRDAPPPPMEELDMVPHHHDIPDHHRVIPPEVLDPNAMIPASRINFRRRDSGIGESPNAKDLRGSPHSTPPSRAAPTSSEGSDIPGEYVLVDDRNAVEVNRTYDEIQSARKRPLRDRKTLTSPTSPADDSQKAPFPTFDSPSAPAPISFPPPPNPNAPLMSGSPSSVGARTNALTRALNAASKKLFGASTSPRNSTHYRDYMSASPRRQQIISAGGGLGLDVDGIRDPMEDALLESLEELAQKTEVITHWADEMYEFVKAIPQKPLPDPNKFERREGELERQAERRRQTEAQQETNAVTCVALYILLMAFSQKGIDKLRDHLEHVQMRDPDGEYEMSVGFDEALTWFKDQFIKCHDRAAQVKTWLPSEYSGPPTFVDQLVYDRALGLSRTAARKELLNTAIATDECEKLYEESLWCLYALKDDLLQRDSPFLNEDHATIETWIKRTKLRLVRCRVRMGMDDRERLKDARLDKNLDDAPHDPAPWDIAGIDEVRLLMEQRS